MFPGDAFEEVADPALLLPLAAGQQEQLFGGGHVVVHLARHNDVVLSVQVIFVALCVAAAALEGGRGLEDVPQGTAAGLAAGGEVIEREDEFVTLVADVGGPITERSRLHHHLLITLTLALVGIQDLEDPWYFFGICAVHVCLSDRSDMEQFIDVQRHEGVGLLSVRLAVVEQDLFTAHDYVFFVPAEAL